MVKYKKPSVTVDIVILIENKFVLIKRRNNPFKDYWAIPGGFVDYGENTKDAAIREAKEETGIDIAIKDLIGVYSDSKRDPRGHTITIVYLAIGDLNKMKASSDASDAKIYSFEDIDSIKLAFDHKKILKDVFDKYTN